MHPSAHPFVSDIAIFVLKRDVKLQLTNFGPPESTTKTANRSVQPFLHRSEQNVAILYNVLRLSVLKLRHSHGDLDPHLTYDSLVHPKWRLDRSSHFWTDDCRVSLYFIMGRPFPASKLPLSMVGSGPPSNTWFPEPTWVLYSNGISIGSVIFAWLTNVTERPTNIQTTLLSRQQ